MSSFSTLKPPKTITVQLLEPVYITDKDIIDTGAYLTGDLVDVVSPKRLKRNADFSFKPTYYTLNGSKVEVKENIKASYTVPLDKGKLTKDVALGVGGLFVKGLSMGEAAIEGAVKNTEDNRLKSSVVSVYKASPVSYIEKGKDINIAESDIFYLKFPDPIQEPNYSYEPENTDNNNIEKE